MSEYSKPSPEDLSDMTGLSDGYFEDPLILRLMQQAQAVDALVAKKGATGETRASVISRMNEAWRTFVGETIEVFGDLYQDVDRGWTKMDNSDGLQSQFVGFGIERSNAGNDRLYYRLQSTLDGQTYHYIAPTSNTINFPEIISTERIEQLAEPFFSALDEFVYAEPISDVNGLMTQLRKFADESDGIELSRISQAMQEIPNRYRDVVAPHIESQLDSMTDIDNVTELALRINSMSPNDHPIVMHHPRFKLVSMEECAYLGLAGFVSTHGFNYKKKRECIDVATIEHSEALNSPLHDDD